MAVPLSKELQPQLSCCACGHLLSVGPVKFSSKGWRCGRCPYNDGVQCTIYELLASGYLFPCKYKKFGCDVLQPFGDKVLEHEFACPKRPHNCPALPSLKCQWEGQLDTIEEHFLHIHLECVLQDLRIEVDLSVFTEKRYVYFHQKIPVYLVELSFNEEQGLSVELIKVLQNSQENTAVQESYDLIFLYEAGRAIFSRNLSSYCLHSNTLKRARNNCFDATFLRGFQTVETITLQFDAPVTKSLTKSSAPPQSNCVQCCKNVNKGCEFMDYLEEVQQHERTCIIYNCPANRANCRWQGPFSSIVTHCKAAHAYNGPFFPANIQQKLGDQEQTTRFEIFLPRTDLFELGLFRICMKVDVGETVERKLLVVVQYIGEAARASEFVFSVYFKKQCEVSDRLPYQSICRTRSFPCIPFLTVPEESLFDYAVPFFFEMVGEFVAEFTVARQ